MGYQVHPKLRQKLQVLLERFAKQAKKNYPPGIQRMAAVYACVRVAHQKANDENERKFWRGYLDNLERKVDELKKARARRLAS